MENKQLLVNKLRCPDGTILESRSRHDHGSHTQEDGEHYFTDGGLAYERYGGTYMHKITTMFLYYGDDHNLLREGFTWGGYGKLGNEPLHYIKLKDLTDDHLEALIDYTKGGAIPEINYLFIDEQKFREESK